MALKITVTAAGRAELINADNTGTAPVTITHVALGAAGYEPDPEQTELHSEIKRLDSIAGEVVADDTISVTAKDEGSDTYTVREFGLITEHGTLLAVYAQDDPILEKASPSTLLLTTDVLFADLDASNIAFGDISFSNPPASESTPGVTRLSNATDSTATDRAATPFAVKQLADAIAAANQALADHKSSGDHDNRYVRLSADQSIAGNKIFEGRTEFLSSSGPDIRLGGSTGTYTGYDIVGRNGDALTQYIDSDEIDVVEWRRHSDGSGFSNIMSLDVETGDFSAQLSASDLNRGTVPIARISSTSSRTSSSTSTLLTAAGMNNHRTSSDHDGRYARRGQNLSDLSSASSARSNLGLGSMATRSSGTGGSSHRTNSQNDSRFLRQSNNLSDLNSAGSARSNLGLGTMATRDLGTASDSHRTNGANDDRFAQYTTTGSSSFTNYPVGSIVFVSRDGYNNIPPRNSGRTIYLSSENIQQFTMDSSAGGASLTGDWRSRGRNSTTGDTPNSDQGYVFQRVS